MNTEISRIEVNITQPISGNATQSDVLNLLSHATLSHEFDNVKYVGRNKKDMDSLKEENHTVITRHPHYWIGKFYDKTEQAINERIRNNLPTDDIPFGLLRMDIILLDRTLTKLFGNKKTLSDVLTAKKSLKFYERDCLYRYDDSVIWGNTSKCEMYETVKPSTVIDGGKCELYDKEESL